MRVSEWTLPCNHPGMDNRPYDIQERTFLFACDVVHFCRAMLDAHPVSRRLSWQLLDAATSVGANTAEADVGQTKPDFRTKIATARKEARESVFWLRLLAATDRFLEPRIPLLLDEARQLSAILTTIKKNADEDDERG